MPLLFAVESGRVSCKHLHCVDGEIDPAFPQGDVRFAGSNVIAIELCNYNNLAVNGRTVTDGQIGAIASFPAGSVLASAEQSRTIRGARDRPVAGFYSGVP